MKIVEKEGKRYVFDPIRRKYLVLTPEEEVRQQVVLYLLQHLDYPKASISLEKAIDLHGTSRRYDIVVYSANQPWLIVECKAPTVKITQEAFDQAANYNRALKVPYLYITNGKNHFVIEVDNAQGEYAFLKELPGYPVR